MNTLLLEPTDVLFFRDGRPMGGASSGHGAAWPLPTVINHAFHAALHRAEINGVHAHRRGRNGQYEETRDRKFGSLFTAGPFPVYAERVARTWFFPRPADAGAANQPKATFKPTASLASSSLPSPLKYPIGNTAPPTKESVASWWSEGAWNAYLGTDQRNDLAARPFYKTDANFASAEHTYGIGIDPGTGTVEEGRFYSASYLRLKEGWRLGAFAYAPDKGFSGEHGNNDLISALLNGQGCQILVGGQQRVCSVIRDISITGRLPLPLGKSDGIHFSSSGSHLVKWVLLTPAIFPEIRPVRTRAGDEIHEHPGGWLPNWIAWKHSIFEGEKVSEGSVLLLDGPGKEKAKRKKLQPGKRIRASLVAAMVPKPVPVTGYALPHEAAERVEGGAKSTHLAVPAGSVYYFACETAEEAQKLAAALNWHGDTKGTEIRNRRSTLLGEKGFGLGVCGTWQFLGKSLA